MADWVHCNKCLVQPRAEQTVKYYLTNCGCIFCDTCLGTTNSCLFCKNNCAIILLTSNLNPEIESYFSDPDNLLQKYRKIREFQHGHRIKLNAQLKKEQYNVKYKYSQMKEYVSKLTQKISSLEKDNLRLRNYIRASVASPANGGQTRTPLATRTNLPNMSQRSTGPQLINRSVPGPQWAQNGAPSSNSTQSTHGVPSYRVTKNRLSLNRTQEYRRSEAGFATPTPSFNASVTSGGSSMTQTPGSYLNFNMSSVSLNSKQGRL